MQAERLLQEDRGFPLSVCPDSYIGRRTGSVIAYQGVGLQKESSWFAVRSQYETSSLLSSAAVAEGVRSLAEPYFSVTKCEQPTRGWKVSTVLDIDEGMVIQRVAASGEEPIEYRVDLNGRHLVHIAPREEEWQVQSLFRATRAVHRTAAARAGMLFVHAGILRLDGMGLLLVGGSRSGKTTFILAAALAGRGVMVCNDDAGIDLGHDGALKGVGWPRSISVRADTLPVVLGADRARAIPSSLRHPANRTIGSLRDSGVEPHGTVLLYLDEYQAITGAAIRESTRIDAVVHLSLADDSHDADVRLLPPSDHAALLRAQIMADPNKHLNIFGEVDPSSAKAAETALLGLPTFRYRYPFAGAKTAVDGLSRVVSDVIRSSN